MDTSTTVVNDPITLAIRTALTEALASFHYGDYKGCYVLFDKKPKNSHYRTFIDDIKKRGISLDLLPEDDKRNFVRTFLPAQNGLFSNNDGFTVIDSMAVKIVKNESHSIIKGKQDKNVELGDFSLTKFAFISDDNYRELGEKIAVKEIWGPFVENDTPTFEFLKIYLNRLFLRFYKLDSNEDIKKRIVYSKKDLHCLFSTGLYADRRNNRRMREGEEIFVLLKRNYTNNKENWRLEDFISRSDNRINRFDFIPEFDRSRDFKDELNEKDLLKSAYGDGKELVDINLKHAVLEHLERFPIKFLKRKINSYKNFDFDNNKTKVNFWREVKGFLDSDAGRDCLSTIAGDVYGELLIQDKLARQANGDYAVKVFYDRENTIQYFLPLYLGENNADVGILCRIHHGRYFGHTVYTTFMAYKGARVLGQLQSSWFTPELIVKDPYYIRDVSNDMKNQKNYK